MGMVKAVAYKINTPGRNGEYLVIIFYIQFKLVFQVSTDIGQQLVQVRFIV